MADIGGVATTPKGSKVQTKMPSNGSSLWISTWAGGVSVALATSALRLGRGDAGTAPEKRGRDRAVFVNDLSVMR